VYARLDGEDRAAAANFADKCEDPDADYVTSGHERSRVTRSEISLFGLRLVPAGSMKKRCRSNRCQLTSTVKKVSPELDNALFAHG
jgi:hypothetical protein